MSARHAGSWIRPFPALVLVALLGCSGTAERLADRAGRAAEREAGQRVDRGVSGAADATEDAVTGDGEARPGSEPDRAVEPAPAAGLDGAPMDAGALYGALRFEGRAAVRGIVFDSDSHVIRPESREQLEAIGDVLRDHPELRLLIEGHTDLKGPEDYNRELSQRRAEAVRQWLVDRYGIDEARLLADGLGEARPVVSEDTPEALELNRRIELVKIG